MSDIEQELREFGEAWAKQDYFFGRIIRLGGAAITATQIIAAADRIAELESEVERLEEVEKHRDAERVHLLHNPRVTEAIQQCLERDEFVMGAAGFLELLIGQGGRGVMKEESQSSNPS